MTPGNPGIPGSSAVSPEDIDADLFVIGPEAPLVDGLAEFHRVHARRERAVFWLRRCVGTYRDVLLRVEDIVNVAAITSIQAGE